MDNMIDNVRNIFEQISGASGSTQKIAIIKRNSDNNLFKKMLRFVYDDFIRTGMTYKTLASVDAPAFFTDFNGQQYDIEQLMRYVKSHNTGAMATVSLVQDFCSVLSNENRDFLYHVFGKDLKIGVTAKTINKALGKGFIREFGVQLAHPYHKYADSVTGKMFCLTQKLDGHRSVFIYKDGQGQFFTRKGLPISGLEEQAKEATEVIKTYGRDMVLDGELLLFNRDDLPTKDLFRATSRVLRSETANKTGILFNVFDALPTCEFEQGKSTQTFFDRKNGLEGALARTIYDRHVHIPHIQIVSNLYYGNDITKIKELQERYVKPNGWEGLMLNIVDGYYQTKRTKDLLKIKEFFDADVVVKDVFEGEGKLKNTLGGIIVDYKGYDVRVGTGFDDASRDYYWNNQDEIIGKVATVQYFEETNNQNDDSISLRFPVFITVRQDKTAEDVSYEV